MNAENKDKHTPLHICAIYNVPQCTSILIESPSIFSFATLNLICLDYYYILCWTLQIALDVLLCI